MYHSLLAHSRFSHCIRNRSLYQQTICLLWWRIQGSNLRPPACKAGALPAELIPHNPFAISANCFVAAYSLVAHVQGVPFAPRSYARLAFHQKSLGLAFIISDKTKLIVQRQSLLRKEVIQPLVLERLPCYDFTPVIGFALGSRLISQLWAPPTSMV